jgi:hypothetical protein
MLMKHRGPHLWRVETQDGLTFRVEGTLELTRRGQYPDLALRLRRQAPPYVRHLAKTDPADHRRGSLVMRCRGRVIRFFDKGYGFFQPEAGSQARVLSHLGWSR